MKKKKNIGFTKKALKHLGWLIKEYNINYEFQTFEVDYLDGLFKPPLDAYSFYNESGCFTIYLVSRFADWRWYFAKEFSNDQKKLLGNQYYPEQYLGMRKNNILSYANTFFKFTAEIIRAQIIEKNEFFGVNVERKTNNSKK